MMKKLKIQLLSIAVAFVVAFSTMVIAGLTPAFAEDGCEHQWSEWRVGIEATCVNDGQDFRDCSICYETEYRTVPATGVHEWMEWEDEDMPTCDQAGSEIRYCSSCGAEEHRTVPATGNHVWDDWVVVKKATVFKKGTKERYCSECNEVQKASTAKLKAFVKFKKKQYTVTKGKKLNLKNKLKYAQGDKVKSWKTSNRRVITINSKGKVTARRVGTAKVTVKMKSGKKTTVKIKVKARKKASKSKKSKSVGTVYWTPAGSVYHSTKNCPTLSRSRTIESGSISACPKSRACKKCF